MVCIRCVFTCRLCTVNRFYMPPDDVGSEPFPENYQWVNKLVATAYDKVSPKIGKRVAHLLVGEWVHVEDDSDPDWVLGSFRGGKGYVRKAELGDENYLEVYFLDVGQGDSILIQTADNRRVLIDGRGRLSPLLP